MMIICLILIRIAIVIGIVIVVNSMSHSNSNRNSEGPPWSIGSFFFLPATPSPKITLHPEGPVSMCKESQAPPRSIVASGTAQVHASIIES